MAKTVLTISLAAVAALVAATVLTGCKADSPVRTPSNTPVPQAQIQEAGAASVPGEVMKHV